MTGFIDTLTTDGNSKKALYYQCFAELSNPRGYSFPYEYDSFYHKIKNFTRSFYKNVRIFINIIFLIPVGIPRF